MSATSLFQDHGTTRPPLGITPDRIWKEKRLFRLIEAIERQKTQLSTSDLEDSQGAIELICKWSKEILELGLCPEVSWG